jgi:hypothetical protein
MTTIIVASVLSVVFVVVTILLIAGSLENAAKIQEVKGGNSSSLQSINNNNNKNKNNHNGGSLSVGPPEKITVTELSKPPVLSPEKKQALQQDQAKTYHSPELPMSDQVIRGPTPGTQAR